MSDLTFGPPTPLRLDDVIFAPDGRDGETAWRRSNLIGELEPIEGVLVAYRGRRCADGVFRDWQALRSRGEARAFVAALVRAPCWRERIA
jgi:hypothetical protein